MLVSGMNSYEMIAAFKEAAVIGDNLSAWPDWTVARLLLAMTQRHQSLVSSILVRKNSGYGNAEEFVTCVPGDSDYPLPDRSVGTTLRMLEYQVPGQQTWNKIDRVDVTDTRYYDRGTASPGAPQTYAIKDSWVELYPTPSAAYVLKMTFFIRPSMIVTTQSTQTAGDASSGAICGLITNLNKPARTCSIGNLPRDYMSTGNPEIISVQVPVVDIIHAAGNFALAQYSVPISFTGSGPYTVTFLGSKDISHVRNGDWIRVQEQAEWPVNLPGEFHGMLPLRSAMEILPKMGRADLAATLAPSAKADLDRFNEVVTPQVKSEPVKIPCRPMYARGRSRWNGR